MFAAVVWHWWLAPVLVASGVGLILATIGGYLNQVSKDRYPPRPPRRD
ncbi:MAG: hypothetical protein AAF567_10610 [Actinomycetota bacterium]